MAKPVKADPSLSGASGGRDVKGRFAAGNKIGVGNPFAKKAHALRSALFKAVSEEDIRECVEQLKKLARGGDIQAIKELLDRTLGKSSEGADINERLDALEALVLEALGEAAVESRNGT